MALIGTTPGGKSKNKEANSGATCSGGSGKPRCRREARHEDAARIAEDYRHPGTQLARGRLYIPLEIQVASTGCHHMVIPPLVVIAMAAVIEDQRIPSRSQSFRALLSELRKRTFLGLTSSSERVVTRSRRAGI